LIKKISLFIYFSSLSFRTESNRS